MKDLISEICMCLAMLSVFALAGLFVTFVFWLPLEPGDAQTWAYWTIGTFMSMLIFGTISTSLDS